VYTPVVYVAISNEPSLDELAEPVGGEFVIFVVVDFHFVLPRSRVTSRHSRKNRSAARRRIAAIVNMSVLSLKHHALLALLIRRIVASAAFNFSSVLGLSEFHMLASDPAAFHPKHSLFTMCPQFRHFTSPQYRGAGHILSKINNPDFVIPHRLQPAQTKQNPGLRDSTASART